MGRSWFSPNCSASFQPVDGIRKSFLNLQVSIALVETINLPAGEGSLERSVFSRIMQEPKEITEFWDDLSACIKERRVIPVVGPELLGAESEGKWIPLYQELAQRLLTRYGLSEPLLRGHHPLNDGVCALAANGHPVHTLYRPVSEILQTLAVDRDRLEPLRQLASVREFDLFVSTTPDDLLVRALNAERFGGLRQTDEIVHSLNLPTGGRRDIPDDRSSRYAAVFYLFGKASSSPVYAIHDEDALEFLYSLQSDASPKKIFSELRGRDLLLVGCTFADWLSRFFLRLSNSERLSSMHRTKKEFLVGEESTKDGNFIVFLQQLSQVSRFYQMDARAFVAELSKRCGTHYPADGAASDSGTLPSHDLKDRPIPETIFISYSKDDIGAARRLFEELNDMNGDVAWFDKTTLMPGDNWEESIARAIQNCGFFLPLISANTEQRYEGYFRSEWYQAVERDKTIQGRKFIFPILIDDRGGAVDNYKRVPAHFRKYQYEYAPAGKMSEALRSTLRKQLRLRRKEGSV